MLTREEIQKVFNASRVVPVPVPNPHGPLGLDHLAAEVQRLTTRSAGGHDVQRPISLPIEAWEKLSGIAHRLDKGGARHLTASDIATSLVLQGIESAEQ